MNITNKNILKKAQITFFLICCLAVFESKTEAQTLLVNYDFASAVAGTPCTATPLSTAPGVTSAFTTGGSGGGTCTTPAGTAVTSPPAFTANANNQAVSLTSFAAGSSNFFQFQLSGVGSYQDYMLFFQSQRSGTGPVNADVQYSTDGTTFTTFSTINPGNGVYTPFTIDLSSVSAIENQPTVFFRILGRDGTGATGTFRIENFQVQAMAATSAPAEISGRITNSKGFGLVNVTVMLTGGDLVDPVYTSTDSRGFYEFPDVPTGATYVLQVISRRYSFTPSSMVLNFNESFTEAHFTGEEGFFQSGGRIR